MAMNIDFRLGSRFRNGITRTRRQARKRRRSDRGALSVFTLAKGIHDVGHPAEGCGCGGRVRRCADEVAQGRPEVGLECGGHQAGADEPRFLLGLTAKALTIAFHSMPLNRQHQILSHTFGVPRLRDIPEKHAAVHGVEKQVHVGVGCEQNAYNSRLMLG